MKGAVAEEILSGTTLLLFGLSAPYSKSYNTENTVFTGEKIVWAGHFCQRDFNTA
jgi:hypothetical protein